MSIEIFINSNQTLGYPRSELEDEIGNLLSNCGEITGGGSGNSGWNIDIEIYENNEFEQFSKRLIDLLKKCQVPSDTFLQIVGKGEIRVYT